MRIENNELLSRLIHCMERDELYLDSHMTLTKLSVIVGTTICASRGFAPVYVYWIKLIGLRNNELI